MPHAGDWRQAEIFREGLEFNHPLIARVLATHAGDLPPRWGFLSVQPRNIVLSALKPARNGDVLLRVYEATGKPVQNGLITFTPQLVSASESNVVEDEGASVRISGNAIACHLHPFEIKNFRLKFKKLSGGREPCDLRRRMQFLSVCAKQHGVQRETPRRMGDSHRGWPQLRRETPLTRYRPEVH